MVEPLSIAAAAAAVEGVAAAKVAAAIEGVATAAEALEGVSTASTLELASMNTAELANNVLQAESSVNLAEIGAEARGVASELSMEAEQVGSLTETQAGKEGLSANASGDTLKLDCVNQGLEGKVHPETGVPYYRDVVSLPNGMRAEGVFPKFESVFEANLPPHSWSKGYSAHFKECINQLQQALKDNPTLENRFTDKQLDQIKNGFTPEGYTWHHHQQTGRMELVDTLEHAKSAHTGGQAIWGTDSTILWGEGV